MADIQLQLAAHLDGLRKEVEGLRGDFAEQTQWMMTRYRSVKWMRLPLSLQGVAVGGALALGEEAGQVCGPKSGYSWSLRRLVVDGLTTGATPDIVNLYRNSSTGQPPLWQFNGNNFGYTFGRLEMVLEGGDTLRLVSVGTFTSTAVIRLSGELIEIPAEKVAVLAE